MPLPTTLPIKKRMSAKELVYIQLRNWIINGTLRPNEKINDQDVSQYFSVSRTPVREAMQLLSDQKLINIIPGKGSSVTPIDYAQTLKAYDILSELNCLALKFAFPNLTQEHLEHLNELNESYAQIAKSSDFTKLTEIDRQFHTLIFQLADSEFLTYFFEILHVHTLRAESIFVYEKSNYLQSYQEHKKIINALIQKDLETALKNMRDNWLHTADFIKTSALSEHL